MRQQQKNKGKTNKGTAAKIAKMKANAGLDVKTVEDVKPTYFDIGIFQKCFKKFSACNGEIRS